MYILVIDKGYNYMDKILENLILDEPKIISSQEGWIGTIYVFINKTNNKLYIGKTIQSYLTRWKAHKNSYKESDKCTRFYAALRKYGWYGFERFVIYQTKIFTDPEECNILISDKEIEFIKKFNTTNPKLGYNISEGGEGTLGLKFSKEVLDKMSKDRCGKNHWNFGNFNNKTSHPILQFSLDFEFVQEWPSMAEIERQLGYKSNNIGNCCNNLIGSYKGFIWVKKEDYFEGYLQKYKSRAKCKSNDCAVLQYDFSGNFIQEHISSAEAGRFFGGKTVSKAANGKDKQAFGYIWIYKKDFSEELLNHKLQEVTSTNMYKKFKHDCLSSN